ncbi:MAG: ATP-binding protein [Holosporales bacterium]|jgi:type II secretory pathway predicted ATPase ExeA|nr:ATP-binding protein [Holosporales bacterium]
MENLQKTNISTTLRNYCNRYKSTKKNDQGVNKAAASLKGVSPATISQILAGNWDLITDDMFRNVAAQIGYKEGKWQPIETNNFRLINQILDDAKENSLVLALIGEAGSGKSFTLRHYTDNHQRVYMLCCSEDLNRRTFLVELLTVLGKKDYTGNTISEMMAEVIRCLNTQESPLLIFDEADKLSDQVLHFFITLYNQLEDRCSIVLCATNFLEKRIRRGVKLNKRGYNEIWSRLGRKCVELPGVTESDIVEMCETNGITGKKTIDAVLQDSEKDLRRVKRKIHATLKQYSKTV